MAEIQPKIRKVISKMPDSPGVYFFIGKGGQTLYIGKATSLKNRVRSYFALDIGEKRSPLIAKMIGEISNIKFTKTDSALEALILESALIKKFDPPYNTADKDQKSFNYVVITDEEFPRVLLVRERQITTPLTPLHRGGEKQEYKILRAFGPFPHGGELREALKIVRKIFPFRDKCSPLTRPCFNYQIGLCPGVCSGAISKKDYSRIIRHIITFFEGRMKKLIKDLEREMKVRAKSREFEEAQAIKRKIFALQHVNDIALLKSRKDGARGERIEAYDVAHTSGKEVVGVMVVIESGEVKKSEYRMFKIRGESGASDTEALREMLQRRFNHSEWKFPDLIVVDGSLAQINSALKALRYSRLKIPVVAVTKDERHRAKEIRATSYESRSAIEKMEKEILLANSEAHRFAIKFHRKLRDKI